MLNIHFFALVRERLQCEGLRIDYEGQHDIAEVKKLLAARGEEWEMLGGDNILVAVNQMLCSDAQIVHDGDEIAFFPPVTGG